MVALALALAACGTPAAAPPDPPATIERLGRAPWGGAAVGRVAGLAAHIHDQLRERHGAADETPYAARSTVDAAALRLWYGEQLGDGWSPQPLALTSPEHGFAFVGGKRALAVGWLDPLPDGRVPVLVMRYDGRS